MPLTVPALVSLTGLTVVGVLLLLKDNRQCRVAIYRKPLTMILNASRANNVAS
jgi:hypothetical protein